MSLYIYPTDYNWYKTLRSIEGLDEVNFWRPSGQLFKALKPGDVFLFRLKAPRNCIAGGGLFAHSSVLPLSIAWDAFGDKNGATAFMDFAQAIAMYRKIPVAQAVQQDVPVGCVILIAPFFLDENLWFPAPSNYSPNLMQGKRYDTELNPGRELLQRIRALFPIAASIKRTAPRSLKMFGNPILVRQRLGQGSFRTVISDIYGRRCAITGEHTLPILQAAHIKPVNQEGLHSTDNGILLRSDVHILFDQGFVTIDPEYRFRVSSKLKENWNNGRTYYQMDRQAILLPRDQSDRPNKQFLEWHNDEVFKK